jgi:GNAT superfamily N-acetyltransferase
MSEVTMLTYSVEKIDDCFEELYPLLEMHWEEVALYKDKVEFDIDLERYLLLEEQGIAHTVIARDNGKIAGYFISFINTHLHYRTTTYALNDVLFLNYPYRHKGIAAELFSFAEKSLKALGVDVIILHMKTDHPFHSLSKHLGYTMAEYTYSKYIGED